VKTVIVSVPSATQPLKGLTGLRNENLLFLKPDEIENRVYTENAQIKDLKVVKVYPSTLSMRINFDKPTLYMEVSDGYFVLGEEGRILSKIKDMQQSLPLLHYYQKFNSSTFRTGETLSFKDIQAAIIFLKNAQSQGLRINSIDITGFNMIALNTDSQRILFSLEKKTGDQVYQLDRVLQQLKMQKKVFKTIDVRFDRVIIEE
jgi:cell division septal protein FtsQ